MRTIVYRGPGHVLRAGGRSFNRGEPAVVDERLYGRLMRDRGARIDVLPTPRAPRPTREPEPPAAQAAPVTAEQGEEESDS